ncbi:P1 family peptidase [Curvibacter sp. HBC61]|uniref:P1 family peptidase n=1 Tax=Curvibacter cyanobacteriorum TaxID=3026422 RepID=A0ABT5N2V3_9BURK|nr:P1 family peptidase [Curvibacter sp. HBC61]MDD0840648.1 P1 family peptidase [Curvibacter sp. HBC61]
MDRRSALGAPQVGLLPSGPLDAITDVAGVALGQVTLSEGAVQTGATVLLPAPGDLFLHKLPAGLAVINGFGKSAGLMQVQELGQLESPIALVSTLAVGTASTALIRDALAQQPELARSLPTLNPLVFECNDGWLNDARALALQEAHVLQALQAARTAGPGAAVAQGAVGAGRGMSCHGLKGGIGTASRRLHWQGQPFTLGALVLANQGRPEALTVAGQRIGPALQRRLAAFDAAQAAEASGPERGSIIIVLATDAPLDARQLQRVARRSAAGLARTGSDYGHGSGDVALAFSTAYRLPQRAEDAMPCVTLLHESALDVLFQAAAEATEQAILHALWAAEPVQGRDGQQRQALTALAPELRTQPPAAWATLL